MFQHFRLQICFVNCLCACQMSGVCNPVEMLVVVFRSFCLNFLIFCHQRVNFSLLLMWGFGLRLRDVLGTVPVGFPFDLLRKQIPYTKHYAHFMISTGGLTFFQYFYTKSYQVLKRDNSELSHLKCIHWKVNHYHLMQLKHIYIHFSLLCKIIADNGFCHCIESEICLSELVISLKSQTKIQSPLQISKITQAYLSQISELFSIMYPDQWYPSQPAANQLVLLFYLLQYDFSNSNASITNKKN